MFADLTHDRDWSQYAFVIVGSGFAGQFLAETLSKNGRVLLLEAGGRHDPIALGEGYYEIESSGMKTPALGTRLSSFGGTSNHWTGQSRPFSPTIFKDRPGIAGWPIFYEDYAVHLPEARAWLGLPPAHASGVSSSLERGLFANHPDLQVLQFHSPKPVPLLGDAATQRRYSEYADIDVLVDTRLVDIKLDASGKAVASVEVAHFPSGQRRSIPARALILCTGGIENARLMLWAGRKYPAGNPLNGGPNNLTGRFYTEHPVYFPVEVYFDSRADLSDAILHEKDNRREHSMWLPSDAFFERHGLLRFGILFQETWQVASDDAEVADLEPLATQLLIAARPAFKFEQTPHEASRVSLLNAVDRDGVGKTHLRWEILPGDFDKYRRGTLLMCELLTRKGFARARLRPEYRQKDWSGIEVARSSHHIGTTRMAQVATAGVVDRNCKVFGLDNMYVAGSSVFPHGDFLNPTLNLLAMAARLAYFLRPKSNPGYAHYRFGGGRPENERLIRGWSHPEDRGIWTVACEAIIRLPRNGAKTLTLYGHAFHKVKVSLTINGAERFSGPAAKLNFMAFQLDEAAVVEIVFRFSQLHSPHDIGMSNDVRLLGFFVERIEFK